MISKHLTLDLLAITIDGLQKAFDRIAAEPEPETWPPSDGQKPLDARSDNTPRQKLAEAQETVSAVMDNPAPETPAPNADELHAQAQQVLRSIAQAEGNAWITGELFPHFDVTSLTAVPGEKLPELITMATEHKKAA